RPRPEPKAGELLVKVGAAGICASDIKCFIGGHTFWGVDGAGGYCDAPVIAGHEFAGTVEALGEGAAERHGVALGDHVVAEQIIPCNACRFCKNGQYWMCEPHIIFGFKKERAEGGMAEYMIYPANSRIHVIDPRIDARQAAYIAAGLRHARGGSGRDPSRRYRGDGWSWQHRSLHVTGGQAVQSEPT